MTEFRGPLPLSDYDFGKLSERIKAQTAAVYAAKSADGYGPLSYFEAQNLLDDALHHRARSAEGEGSGLRIACQELHKAHVEALYVCSRLSYGLRGVEAWASSEPPVVREERQPSLALQDHIALHAARAQAGALRHAIMALQCAGVWIKPDSDQ